MGFRLFVSHSTPVAELPRLTALVAAIQAASDGAIEVVYDKTWIEPGDEWRRRIAFMLHACHAAVVLADERALASKWVLTEAIYLSLRNQVDPQFQFIPISFLPAEGDAGTAAAREARKEERAKFAEGPWGTVDLERLQQARGATPEQVATLIVAALRSKGQLVPHQSPVDRLALQLATSFGGISDALLDAVITELGEDPGYAQADRSLRVAMAITRDLVENGRLSRIRDVLDGLGLALPDDRLLAVLDALAPLPLDAKAAALLTRKRALGPGCVHVRISSTRPDRTVPWYIARANLAGRPKVLPINNADAAFASLQVDLRAAWRLQNRRLGDLTDDEVDEQLRTTPRYVTLPGTIDAEVLDQLDTAYPAISFVMFDTQGIDRPLPPNVIELDPRLDPDREKEIIRDYHTAIDSLS
jgi:TIR domain